MTPARRTRVQRLRMLLQQLWTHLRHGRELLSSGLLQPGLIQPVLVVQPGLLHRVWVYPPWLQVGLVQLGEHIHRCGVHLCRDANVEVEVEVQVH